VRTLHHDHAVRVETALADERGEQHADLVGLERVGRVEQHEVVGLRRQIAEEPRRRGGVHVRVRGAERADVRPDHVGRPAIGLDQVRVRSTPRQGLEPERPGPGEQVEHAGAIQAAQLGLQRRVHRLAHPVGGRTGAVALRRLEAPATPFAGDDAGHVRSR
jgi:hypothetical protein